MTWRARAVAGSTLLGAGLCLAAWGGWTLLRPVSAPYRYEVDTAVAPFTDAATRAMLERARIVPRQARLVARDGDAELARLRYAETADGPVLLDWQPRVDEPFLTTGVPLHDVAALGDALRRHLPPDARLLAWWDTSRLLALLCEAPVRFAHHLVDAPLALPASWNGARRAIERTEAAFWRAAPGGAHPDFDRWVAALLASPRDGAAILRELSDGRRAFVAVHARDALLLGALAPARLGVAFRDLPEAGELHGAISGARQWVRERGYPAYTVYAPGEHRIRVVALADDAARGTLIAALLPFVEAGQPAEPAPDFTLVHQVGGFWIYRLEDPAAAATGAPREAPASAAGG